MKRSPAARRVLLALIVAACAASAVKLSQRPVAANFQVARIEASAADSAYGSRFVSRQHDIATHAASFVELKDGRLRAFWFAGSHEGAQDVVIRSAVFDGSQWSAERDLIDREQTQQALLRYVKKLGNPVAARAADGSLRLYYVTVSLGGWAGSSLTTMASNDEGETWSTPRRLITSPFLNISTLVKGTPFRYSDGSIGLPVYHEFLGKFGELLRLSADGTVLDKQRLSAGRTAIQPVVLIRDPDHALALMRYTGIPPMRAIATETQNGGRAWGAPFKTAQPNPDAALTGVVLPDGRMLAVLNNLEQGRHALSLMLSVDAGRSWRVVHELEREQGGAIPPEVFVRHNAQLAQASDAQLTDAAGHGQSAQRNKCEGAVCGYEFSYPYMIQTRNGDLHLVYTWNRSYIKHVQFNRAWLDARIGEAGDAAVH